MEAPPVKRRRVELPLNGRLESWDAWAERTGSGTMPPAVVMTPCGVDFNDPKRVLLPWSKSKEEKQVYRNSEKNIDLDWTRDMWRMQIPVGGSGGKSRLLFTREAPASRALAELEKNGPWDLYHPPKPAKVRPSAAAGI